MRSMVEGFGYIAQFLRKARRKREGGKRIKPITNEAAIIAPC